MDDQLRRHRPTSAAVRYRALRRFYRWTEAEEQITRSPMTGMTQPTIPDEPVPVITEDELGRLFKATSGKGFEQRRDQAILRVLLDTGVRLSELVGLTVDDVDLDVHDVIHIKTGKGGHGPAVPFGAQTGKALDRYLRERTSHARSGRPELWLGTRGPMSVSGVTQMLRRRGKEVGDHRERSHRDSHDGPLQLRS